MRKRIALRISVIVHKILNTSPKLSLWLSRKVYST
jgi:hypothetical protein